MGKLGIHSALVLAIGTLSACGGGATAGTGTSSGTTGSPGAVAPPAPSVPPGIYANDFKLALTSTTPGATICFTLDGSTPACAAGACQGSAATYSSQAQIPIDGTATSTAPGTSFGSVTVTALACKAGQADGTSAPGTYTLQVAEPTLSNPPTTSPISYSTATVTPTVSSATEGANALYTTTTGTPPTCTNGTALARLPAQLSFTASSGNAQFLVIGCKTGYQPSTVLDAAYAFALSTPLLTPVSSGATHDSPVHGQIDDSANAGSGDSLCLNFSAGAPNCACDAGVLGTAGGITPFTIVNTDGGVQALACPPAGSPFAASAVASSGVFTLELDPVQFSPASGTLIPYAGDLEVTIAQSDAGQPYDFICLSRDGTVPDCTCNVTAQPTWTKFEVYPALVSVPSPGPLTLQAVGCLDPGGPTFLPSNIPAAVATYPAAPPLTAPTILPTSGIIATDPQPVTFTNNDDGDTAYFCYTLNDTAPSCFAAGSADCTTSATAAGTTSTDGPEVSASGTTVRAIACDFVHLKPPSAEATPVTFTN